MKAKIVNSYEGQHRTSALHTYIMIFNKVSDNNCKEIEEPYDNYDYSLTVNLSKLYANDRSCKTNGSYDPQKGLAKVIEDYPIGTLLDYPNMICAHIPISEISDYPYVINADDGKQLYAFNRLFFVESKEMALNQLSLELKSCIDRGQYIIPNTRELYVISCREVKYDNNQHLVVLSLIDSDNIEDKSIKLLKIAQIGTAQYRLHIDLRNVYYGNQHVHTGGQYDAQKAFELFKKTYLLNSFIDLDCELFDFTITELTDGQFKMLDYAKSLKRIGIYHHADFGHDFFKAKENCKHIIQEYIRIGYFIPVKG